MKPMPVSLPVSDDVLIALRCIIQYVDLHSKHLEKQFGLTGPQLIVLKEISRAGELSASQLSRAISLSQATVTGILDRLERRGLISRRRSSIDRRRVIVEVSSAGRQLLEAAPPPMQESFTRQFEELQTWEQHMILSSLQRLVTLMGAKQMSLAPILTTGPITRSQESPETE
jgi:DNA-binding MarR family transcriptional regulator